MRNQYPGITPGPILRADLAVPGSVTRPDGSVVWVEWWTG